MDCRKTTNEAIFRSIITKKKTKVAIQMLNVIKELVYQPKENMQTILTINMKQEAINHCLDCPLLKQKLRKYPFTFKDHTVLTNFQETYIPWNRL